MSLSTARFTRWPAVLRGTTFFCGGSLPPSRQAVLLNARLSHLIRRCAFWRLAESRIRIFPWSVERSKSIPPIPVEVRSPSTEDVDRISKRRDYQRIPSLQEYVLVSQDEPRVEVYRRQGTGSWEYIDVRVGIVQLATGPTLDLSALYRDLPD